MPKDIPLAGSEDRNDGKWERAQKNDHQTDYYVGSNDGGGKHCHMFREHDTGKSGVEHRGECGVCDDRRQSTGSSSTSSSEEE